MKRYTYSKFFYDFFEGEKIFTNIILQPDKTNNPEWFDIFNYYSGEHLVGVDFSNSNLYNPHFEEFLLREVIFNGAKIYIDVALLDKVFKESILENVDFRNMEIWIKNEQWEYEKEPLGIKSLLTDEQIKNNILDDETYKKFLERKNQEQKTQLESTSNQQTSSLLGWFKNLEEEYHLEEKFWIRVVSIIVFVLIFLVLLPIILKVYPHSYTIIWPIIFFISLFLVLLKSNEIKKELNPIETKLTQIESANNVDISQDKQENPTLWQEKKGCKKVLDWVKNFWIRSFGGIKYLYRKVRESTYLKTLFYVILSFIFLEVIKPKNFDIKNFENIYYSILPIIILFVTLLYFSVTQYSKSKKLRIDNQNKIALIHGMIAIKADTTNMEKWRFYDKIADIVFDRVHHEKEENLPLDKIIQLIKAINPKDSQK